MSTDTPRARYVGTAHRCWFPSGDPAHDTVFECPCGTKWRRIAHRLDSTPAPTRGAYLTRWGHRRAVRNHERYEAQVTAEFRPYWVRYNGPVDEA